MRNLLAGTIIILSLALQGCTSQQMNRSVYEALYQKQCMDRVGAPNCDPQHPSYDEYSRSRVSANIMPPRNQ